MRRQFSQTGSTLMIVTVVLFLALMGTLGFVFYQNFVAPVRDPNVENQQKANNNTQTNANTTERVAFNSDIYEVIHPKGWTPATKKYTAANGQPGTNFTMVNAAGTIRVALDISGADTNTPCDANDGLKVRYYDVKDSGNTKLTGSSLFLVATMTDQKDGGYQYAIGLTQEGGDVHASLDDPRCTVAHVGEASTAVFSDDHKTLKTPTILAKIDFPKLSGSTPNFTKDMQQVKDILSSGDYKTAVSIMQSAVRK